MVQHCHLLCHHHHNNNKNTSISLKNKAESAVIIVAQQSGDNTAQLVYQWTAGRAAEEAGFALR
jgi:hypothetical protein